MEFDGSMRWKVATGLGEQVGAPLQDGDGGPERSRVPGEGLQVGQRPRSRPNGSRQGQGCTVGQHLADAGEGRQQKLRRMLMIRAGSR